MKHGAASFFLVVFLVANAGAETDMNALIEEMVEQRWAPHQKALAEEISGPLLGRLQQESAKTVVEGLSSRARQSIGVVTWEDAERNGLSDRAEGQ